MPNTALFDIALTNYNERSGRYGLPWDATGDVTFDGTAAYQVQTAAGCVAGAWWADTTLGSDLSTIKHITSRTPQQAQAMLAEAMDPLVRLNYLSEAPTVQTPQRFLGAVNILSLDLTWTGPGGAAQSGSVQL